MSEMVPMRKQIFGLIQSLFFGNLGIYLLFLKADESTRTDAMLIYSSVCLFVMAFGGLFWIAAAVNIVARAVGNFSGGFVAAAVTEFRAASGPRVAPAPAPTSEVEVAEVVSRMRLNNALAEMVARAHAGRSISRKVMVDLRLTTQPYWNLANYILAATGLREGQTWVAKGSETDDLRYLSTHYKVENGDTVFVLPAGAAAWESVDLYAVHFLKHDGEAE